MLNLVLFGPPGAGKGTQSEKLIAKYNLVHISTGDIFRAHISNQTELGKQVSQIIAEGNLVPDSITIAMLEEEIKQNPQAKGFIFDGFPRTVAQAEALDAFLIANGTAITGVVALDVTEEVLTERIAKRQEISGRADDAADKLKKRIEEYFGKTIHVLPYYEAQGKLTKVNGIGEIETIFADLSAVIDGYNA
ncbi:adenylate kinase [Sphingobacterium rhinopitheci]|uniref:adenylate kinase n=1 Tax=Sphingobacterium rhinopitheci TaxID=2781960 RepID=UPI001F5178FB|nr:adenylate kinase [Sphingobacterium rhinopitheci]MCI0919815.1 adenylate kinase [Sphingobacterium rhinopitheci]